MLLFVLDIDNLRDWEYYLWAQGQVEPKTVTVKTGSGGKHLYFKYDDRLAKIKSASKVFKLGNRVLGIDVRTTGGCVIAPPTDNSVKGHRLSYAWTGGKIPESSDFGEVPDWLVWDLLGSSSESSKVSQNATVQEQVPGNRIKIESRDLPESCHALAQNLNKGPLFGAHIYRDGEVMELHTRSKDHPGRTIPHKLQNQNLVINPRQGTVKIKCQDPECPEPISVSMTNEQGEMVIPETLFVDVISKMGEQGVIVHGVVEVRPEDSASAIGQECESEVSACNVSIDTEMLNDSKLTSLCNEEIFLHQKDVLAQIIAHLNPRFRHSGSEMWYCDEESNRWIQDDDNLTLIKKGIPKAKNVFVRILAKYQGLVGSQHILTGAKRAIQALANESTGVVGLCKAYMYDPTLKKKLDSKQDLVPFNNGVFDLTARAFRHAEMEDYVTVSVGYNYDPEVKDQSLEAFLDKILPNKKVQKYVLSRAARGLDRRKNNRIVLLCMGRGKNGKSMLFNLLQAAFGDRAVKLDISLLTRKRGAAEGPSSSRMSMKGAWIIYVSEPDQGEKLNIGLVKELTGNELIAAREMREKTQQFRVTGQIFMGCNENSLEVPANADAIWDRIREIRFPHRFVSNPDPNNPTEFPADESVELKVKDEGWRQTFMNKLLELYYEDIEEPEEVMQWTKAYRESNGNIYEKIRDQYLVKDPAPGAGIGRAEMEALVRWYARAENMKIPDNLTQGLDKALANEELDRNRRRWGPKQSPGWRGWRRNPESHWPLDSDLREYMERN